MKQSLIIRERFRIYVTILNKQATSPFQNDAFVEGLKTDSRCIHFCQEDYEVFQRKGY